MLNSRQQKGKEFLAFDGFNHDTCSTFIETRIYTLVPMIYSWLLQVCIIQDSK